MREHPEIPEIPATRPAGQTPEKAKGRGPKPPEEKGEKKAYFM